MSDFEFKLTGRVFSKTAIVEREALSEIVDKDADGNVFPGHVLALIRWRRVWLARLRRCGWEPIQAGKFGFARNCRPPLMKFTPKYAQACTLSPCPFCHVRHINDIYCYLMAAADYYNDEKLALIIYRKELQLDNDGRMLIQVGAAGDVDWTDFASLQYEYKRIRAEQYAEYIHNCHAGYSWYTMLPVLEPISDTIIGNWHMLYVVAALMPVKWGYPNYPDITAVQLDNPELPQLLGRAFRYPSQLMKGNMLLLAQLFNKTKGQRTFCPLGMYRKVKRD